MRSRSAGNEMVIGSALFPDRLGGLPGVEGVREVKAGGLRAGSRVTQASYGERRGADIGRRSD
jgi:hypothetical protein